MDRAVAYYRVSTKQQHRSDLGIEAQRATIARFAEAENLQIIAECVEAETGKGADALNRRPQLAAALAAARTAKSCVLVLKARPAVARCRVRFRPDGAAGPLHRRRTRT